MEKDRAAKRILSRRHKPQLTWFMKYGDGKKLAASSFYDRQEDETHDDDRGNGDAVEDDEQHEEETTGDNNLWTPKGGGSLWSPKKKRPSFPSKWFETQYLRFTSPTVDRALEYSRTGMAPPPYNPYSRSRSETAWKPAGNGRRWPPGQSPTGLPSRDKLSFHDQILQAKQRSRSASATSRKQTDED
jgi:hypothetical protein